MDDIIDDIDIKNINLTTVLNLLKNDIFIHFTKTSEYNQNTEQEKLVSKITRNINIINKLYVNEILYHNEIIINIYKILKKLVFLNNNNLIDYKKIRKMLGYIIFDIYRYSSYHLLMSNIPTTIISGSNDNTSDTADINDIDNTEIVNSEIMYDTIQHYIGLNTVDTIFQVSDDNYLVKMKNIYDSEKVCHLLNKMQISNNIIKVELLNPLPVVVVEEINENNENLDNQVSVEKITIDLDAVSSSTSNTSDNTSESNISDNLIVSDILTSSTEKDDETGETIIHISIEQELKDAQNVKEEKDVKDVKDVKDNSSLLTNISSGIYNKISNAFSFFSRR